MSNGELLLEMVERMSVAATIAFLLSQTAVFRRLVYRQGRSRDRLLLSAVFGLLGIFGTYAGIPVNDALANSRVIGVMAAGLTGGTSMGLLAGLIAGGHRFFLGGFTALACAVANLSEGLLAGFVQRRFGGAPVPWWAALLAGMVGEMMQMGIILLLARPFDAAQRLVGEIALPMIVANSIGLAIFMLIIKSVMDVQDRAGAEQSRKALDIATKTLPYLRRGLDEASGLATAQIIFAAGGYDAVAVTNEVKVLAYIGAEEHHHCQPHYNGLTAATRHVLAEGKTYIAQNAESIGCSCTGCRLASAMVVPLKRGERVVGTLKLYYTRPEAISQVDMLFADGLAHLFSTQLELAEIDRQAKLTAKAELRALQAQINPHFFFNTLNTITSLVRTKPEQARELLLKLGAIFRYNLHKAGTFISVAEEMEQVNAYLAIEKARHGDKLCVREDVAESAKACRLPALTVQPLVENAIRHGLQPKENGGTVWIRVSDEGEQVCVQVSDDGVGIDLARQHPLLTPDAASIGLVNVHERLRGMFGAAFGLTLESRPGAGTTVSLRLPKGGGEGDEHA
ncbi:sensor histidine kinase [Azotosporobacter soli]|uniref:sensor histidine kinase n=1 Tax=Azotosporobacter soli TaxID=3055040 RepID=UPI0031FEEFC5